MSGQVRDLVAIGASAGGVEALRYLLGRLPVALPATVFVTVHRPPASASGLAAVLGRAATLPVREPADRERFRPRTIYLAPSDHHMVVCKDRLHRLRTPKQHHTRPAIDPMMTSLAEAYGARVIGVLLTGNLSDGVAGLVAIKAADGLSLVQDPEEAVFSSMPRNALLYDHVDLVFRLEVAHAIITALVRGETIESIQRGGRTAS